MKYLAHVPVEQYGFVSVEWEADDAALASEAYNAIARQFKQGTGVTEREMNKVIDKMITNESVDGGIDIWERMNREQQYATQCLKRAIKRINRE